VPLEAQPLEALHRLFDQAFVLANDTERAEGERLEVRARAETREGVVLECLTVSKRGERVEPRDHRCELPTSEKGLSRPFELPEQPFHFREIGSMEREPDQGLGSTV
jgi:hypothetical protein